MESNKEQYYLSQDQSCHWYVVPLSRKEDWDKFNELSEDDERSWDLPHYVESIGGSPSLVLFENYKIK